MGAVRIRIAFAIFCAILSIALGVFVWIMLDVRQSDMSPFLLRSLALVVFVTIAAQVIYALKGQVFEFDGRLAKREILFAIICIQFVMQISFGFSVYAANQTQLQNDSFDSAYMHFIKLQQSAPGNRIEDYLAIDLEMGLPANVEKVLLVTDANADYAGQYYHFPISGGALLMSKSSTYANDRIQEFALSLIMSLIISVLLMAEMVYFAVKFIDSRFSSAAARYSGYGDGKPQDKSAADPMSYLRQIAFLFYFTGYLGASFIPLMARDLVSSNPNADFIAGTPYSVEAIANCAAIILAPRFFNKRGWKPPYVFGAGIFIVGLVFSAISPNIIAFIASRAVIGLGYGFCWMTLRSVASESSNRANSFAGLTSGIYAGMMCSVAFGSVLADMVGYTIVLLISAAMAAAALVFPMMLRNTAGERRTERTNNAGLTMRDVTILAAFMLAVVIPTCITDAFGGYLAPLYVNSLELPTASIGRVSLVYNLCFVYLSSTLLIKVVGGFLKNSLLLNVLHVFIVSAAMIVVAYAGGFIAIVIAGAMLGSADGFGFSVQNSYILSTQAAAKIGVVRMLTFISLFKKLIAVIAPMVLGLFIINGFGGLGAMGLMFIAISVLGAAVIMALKRGQSPTYN